MKTPSKGPRQQGAATTRGPSTFSTTTPATTNRLFSSLHRKAAPRSSAKKAGIDKTQKSVPTAAIYADAVCRIQALFRGAKTRWKLVVCRIQVLFRGARTRWKLVRRSNQAFTRVVLRQAGRPGEVPDLGTLIEIGQSKLQNNLTIDTNQATNGSSPATSAPSSIGASSEMVLYRPSAASSAIAGSSPGATPTSQYRTLTSTAVERKRTVAACRALRAQIQRFEDAFIQLHGRAPKGAAEQAPLATTYVQYREWKRAIRTDAVCRIQALLRGARTRWKLLRDFNQAFARVVLRQAGRPGEVPDLRIPIEVGHSEQQNNLAIDTHQATNGSSPAPSAPSSIGASSEMVLYRPSATSSASAGSSPGATPTSQYRTLTSTAVERKRTVAACRALRAQIQRFEDAFIQVHGRAPKGAAERAPLETTYAQYREWKRAIRTHAACRIQALFRGARTRWQLLRDSNQSFARVVFRRAGRPGEVPDLRIPIEVGQSEQQNNLAIDTSAPRPYSPVAAPHGSSELANLTLAELLARKRDLKQQLKQNDMNFARRHGRLPVRAEKEPIRHLYESYKALKSQISLMEQEGRHLQPAGTSSSDPSLDLAALKAEKSQLHQMLRSYEKDFFKEHKRQVSSVTDIKPFTSQYRRYKEIKNLIAPSKRNVPTGPASPPVSKAAAAVAPAAAPSEKEENKPPPSINVGEELKKAATPQETQLAHAKGQAASASNSPALKKWSPKSQAASPARGEIASPPGTQEPTILAPAEPQALGPAISSHGFIFPMTQAAIAAPSDEEQGPSTKKRHLN